MRLQGPVGPYLELVEAPSPQDLQTMVRLGVRQETFKRHLVRVRPTVIAQYYGIVQDGLVISAHLFQGLQRPLSHGGDLHADEAVLIYSWRPQFDYEWVGNPYDGSEYRREPPPGRVFVVLVRQEPSNEFNVMGSIEQWNWIREDGELNGAPIDWRERYKTLVWSRPL